MPVTRPRHALTMPVTWTARCQADVTRPEQHSARKLAASARIALPSILVPVSPRPDARTPMIPSTAVADSEKMTKRSRNFRAGNFTGITSSFEFLLSHARDGWAAAPEYAYSAAAALLPISGRAVPRSDGAHGRVPGCPHGGVHGVG